MTPFIELFNDFKALSEEISRQLPLALQENAKSPQEKPNESYSSTNCFAIIQTVLPGSIAELAGLQVGDYIHKINELTKVNFNSLSDVAILINKCKLKGDPCVFTVYRLGKSITITISDPSKPLGLYLAPVLT